MATWGSCDFQQLQRLRDNLEQLQRMDLDIFCRDVSRELAARLLALVIPATPVGKYKKSIGKKGGTLRRGWTAQAEGEAAVGHGYPTATQAKAYAWALPIVKAGGEYRIEVINPVHYASYVELGHRTVSGGWVEGKYFPTISEQKLQELAPALIEQKLERLLQEVFRV